MFKIGKYCHCKIAGKEYECKILKIKYANTVGTNYHQMYLVKVDKIGIIWTLKDNLFFKSIK